MVTSPLLKEADTEAVEVTVAAMASSRTAATAIAKEEATATTDTIRATLAKAATAMEQHQAEVLAKEPMMIARCSWATWALTCKRETSAKCFLRRGLTLSE